MFFHVDCRTCYHKSASPRLGLQSGLWDLLPQVPQVLLLHVECRTCRHKSASPRFGLQGLSRGTCWTCSNKSLGLRLEARNRTGGLVKIPCGLASPPPKLRCRSRHAGLWAPARGLPSWRKALGGRSAQGADGQEKRTWAAGLYPTDFFPLTEWDFGKLQLGRTSSAPWLLRLLWDSNPRPPAY